jgi:hypothetical protein
MNFESCCQFVRQFHHFGAESVQCHFKEPLMQNLYRPPTLKLYLGSIYFQQVLIRYFSRSKAQVTIFLMSPVH